MTATVRRGALFALTAVALALPATARAETAPPGGSNDPKPAAVAP